MSAARAGGEITLSGPPRHVKAVVGLDVIKKAVVPVALHLKDGPTVVRSSLRARGEGRSELRVKLPHHTPPGEYRGEAVVDGTTLAVVIEVSPVLDVRVEPRLTRVSAGPGGRAEFEVTVSNEGNVAVEVPKTAELDLDAEDQDRALGRALRADLAEGERRVDRLFEELRESHGGEGRVTVLEGAGTVEGGGRRQLRCRLDVPMTADSGRTYSGSWDIGNAGHFLTVDVLESDPGTPRTRGRRKP